MHSNTRQILSRTNDERDHILIARPLIQKVGKHIQAAAVGRAAQEALVEALHHEPGVLVARDDRGSDLRARNAVCERLAERYLTARIHSAVQRVLVKSIEESARAAAGSRLEVFRGTSY